jgi:hypothetical protein
VVRPHVDPEETTMSEVISGAVEAIASSMPETSIFVPAILFPAIPLMMINFGNRYSTMSALIRRIHDEFVSRPEMPPENAERYLGQIATLRRRLYLVRAMQTMAATAFFLNLATMLAIYARLPLPAHGLFTVVLAFMMAAMLLFVVEIQISAKALELHLSDVHDMEAARRRRRRSGRVWRRDPGAPIEPDEPGPGPGAT